MQDYTKDTSKPDPLSHQEDTNRQEDTSLQEVHLPERKEDANTDQVLEQGREGGAEDRESETGQAGT